MSATTDNRNHNFDYRLPQVSVEEYLLPFKDYLVEHFINDRKIRSAEKKSGCQVRLLPKSINRKIRNAGWVKYAIIQISGPKDNAIVSCTKAIETFYPNFVLRKPYERKSIVSFFIEDGVPDNLNYSESVQRSAQTDCCFHNMRLNSSYTLDNRTDNPGTKPWKITESEKYGQFNPHLSHIYNAQFHMLPQTIQFRQPILKTVSGKTENSHLLNDPYSANSFMRYLTNASKTSEVHKPTIANSQFEEENISEDNKKVNVNYKSAKRASDESSLSPKPSIVKSSDPQTYKISKNSAPNNLFDNKNFVQTRRSSSQ